MLQFSSKCNCNYSRSVTIEEGFIQKRRQRSSLLFGGQNWFNALPHYRLSARMIWRIGWIEQWTLGGMDASEKIMIFKNFSLNNPWCYSKWLVRHSSSSPKRQRRPCLPFCINHHSMTVTLSATNLPILSTIL